tara:strand:- start:80 stop:505 length:426 start_codon:yes stop_codon:yes gene_type:complete
MAALDVRLDHGSLNDHRDWNYRLHFQWYHIFSWTVACTIDILVLVTDHLVWHYPLQQPYDEAYTQEREEEEEIEDRRRNSRCSSRERTNKKRRRAEQKDKKCEEHAVIYYVQVCQNVYPPLLIHNNACQEEEKHTKESTYL